MGKSRRRGRGTQGRRNTPADGHSFHVFFSYRSQDVELVREIVNALKARGLKPWFDKEQIPPGAVFQDELQKGIEASAAAVVAYRAKGAGPWQSEEIRVLLQHSVSLGKPVIPVLLPGASKRAPVPAFLSQRSWLDLSEGITDAKIDELVWGITGARCSQPVQPPPGQPPDAAAARDQLPDEPSRRPELWGEIQFHLDALIEHAAEIACRLADGHEDSGLVVRSAVAAVLNGLSVEEAVLLGSVERVDEFVAEMDQHRRERLQRYREQSDAGHPVPAPRDPIRILHLSDLGFTDKTLVRSEVQALEDDIVRGEALGFVRLDFLVVSGDVSDGSDAGFGLAADFVLELARRFKIPQSQCVLVPGDDDCVHLDQLYNAIPGQPGPVLQRELFPKRFEKFSALFHQAVTGAAYPLEFDRQGVALSFPDYGLRFITLNSSWEIDGFHADRSGINRDALAYAVQTADRLLESQPPGRTDSGRPAGLLLGVWHHAEPGNERLREDGFLASLHRRGMRICLHGDVRELRCELVSRVIQKEKPIHVIGAGSLGADASGRRGPGAHLYNLLAIDRDFGNVRIHTRVRPQAGGPWQPWSMWPGGDGGAARWPYFDVRL